MNEKRDFEIEISLPAPLDEPMKKLGEVITKYDLADAINELVERQNALIEIIKGMIPK